MGRRLSMALLGTDKRDRNHPFPFWERANATEIIHSLFGNGQTRASCPVPTFLEGSGQASPSGFRFPAGCERAGGAPGGCGAPYPLCNFFGTPRTQRVHRGTQRGCYSLIHSHTSLPCHSPSSPCPRRCFGRSCPCRCRRYRRFWDCCGYILFSRRGQQAAYGTTH